MEWKEIFTGILIGSILGGGSSFVIQSNEMTALKTEFKLLKESSLDFKNNQKQLGEISLKQKLLDDKEIKLTKLQLSLESEQSKLREKELSLEVKSNKVNKLFENLKRERNNIEIQNERLSLVSRGEKYMNEYISNYSNIDRGIVYSCDNQIANKFNNEYNNKVRKANSLLTAIEKIGKQLPYNNEFLLFFISENNKVRSYSNIRNCE